MNKHTPLMSAHNHYSLRKMSIGLVSVLLGTSLYLGVNQNNAQAATAPAINAEKVSEVKADGAAKAKAPISSALNKEVAPAPAAKPILQSESNASAPKSEDKAGIEQAGKQTSNDQKADKLTDLSLKGSKSAQLSEKEAAASAKEEKGLKPKLLKAQADPTENGLKLQQQTPDGKASLAWTYTDSTGAEHTGHNMLGHYESGRPIHLSFFINDVPGTQWSLSIPVADGKEYSINYQTPNPSQTTFTHTGATDADPYETFSGATVANKTIRIQFTLMPYTNSILFDPKKTPIDTGNVHRQVKWSINKQPQTPLDFINRIKPTLKPFTGRVKDPNDPSYSVYDNDDPKKDEIFPKADYEYVLDLNETPGITDADGFPTGKVNQVVNNGTTIRIPVDKNFELDSAITNSMNNFAPGDRTTITQAGVGKDIIINVPANSGVQRLDKYGQLAPYFIIGKYNVEIPDGTRILTATSGKITIKQTLKDPSVPGGSTVLTAELDPWKEEITGVRVPVVPSKMLININGAEGDKHLPLGAVQDKILTYFGFKNQTGLPLDGQNKLQITLKMGDGLAVKQIKTPKSNSLLPGTTSYTYTVNYWNDPTPGTGTIAAGSSIPAPTGKLIKSIILTPNYWTPVGGTEDFPEPGNLTVFHQNEDIVDFQAIGDLADTYQTNGQPPVKAGDGIKSSITIAITPQGAAKPIENSRDITQTVVGYASVPAELGIWRSQTNKAAGTEKAGYIAINETGGSKQKYIQSPIFYYVLPQNAQVAKNSDGSWDVDGFNHDNNEDVTVKPKITVFKIGDRQVVKLDYSKTGYKFNTSIPTNNLVYLDNVTNAPNGTNYGYIYIVSPTTKINSKYNPIIDTSKTGAAAYPSDYPSAYSAIFPNAPKDFDPAWVEKTSKNVYLVCNFPWEIDQAAATNTPSITAGNKDASLVQTGKSDDKGGTQMQYAIEIVNNDSNRLQNIDQIINLPTAALNNDSFTFNLTQPISLSSGQSLTYHIKYSDQPAVLTTDQNSRPDISSYKKWDAFTDKSKIRSAVIIIPSIPANSTIGKFVLTGEDPTVAEDAGKTGTLASGAYIDSLIPFVIDENNHADEIASIKVSGQSTIKFRYHYKDSNGTDHYINITSASKTYNDNEDTMLSKADTQAIAEANKDLIPAGYRSDLNSDPSKIEVSIINGDKTWQSNADNGKADFGQQVKYYFDSDIVQFELTPNTPTPPAKQDQKAELRFYDDDANSFITAAPDQADTGKTGDSISFANGNKQTQDLIKAGYEFVGITKGSDPDSTDFLTKSKYQDADFGTFDDVDDPADAAPSQVFIVHFKKQTTPPAMQDQTAELRFYDDDTHSFITAAPDQTATGKTGDPINFTNGSQQTQALLDNGYEFVGITKGSDPDSTNFLTKSKYQYANFGTFDDIDDPADATPSQVFIVHFKNNKPGENPGGGGNKPGQNPGGKPGNKPGNKPSGKPSNKPGKPSNTPGHKPSSQPDNKPGEKPSQQPSQPASTPNKTSKPQQVIKHGQQPVGSIAKTSKAKAIRKSEAPQAIPSKNKLPQTGSSTQLLAWLGLGLTTLAAIIGLAADRKH